MNEGEHRGNVLIFGGTFNPVHIGHLRLALEASNALGSLVDRVEFLPANIQPLKNPAGILPFEWRCRMVEEAIRHILNFSCNRVEGNRAGPSYTYDTLLSYPGTENSSQRFFLLGNEDFAQLRKWRNGVKLPEVCNLVVVPRNNGAQNEFLDIVKSIWQEFAIERLRLTDSANSDEALLATLHNGGKIYYLKIPFLDISSTRIRRSWLKNESIAWLVPEQVSRFLDFNRQQIFSVWE